MTGCGSEQAPGTCHSVPRSCEAQDPVRPPPPPPRQTLKKKKKITQHSLLQADLACFLWSLSTPALGPAGLSSGVGGGQMEEGLEAVVCSWDFS